MLGQLEAQGPYIAHLITNSKQFSQIKRQPEWQDSNKCMCCLQYISMLLWTFCLKEDFVKGEALPLPIFAPFWIYPLEYLAKTTTRMAEFQVKPFVFEALWILLALHWIHPRADLIKKPKHMCRPWELHPYKVKHQLSGSVVKADYLCSHIYTCISAPPPFLHLNKYIKISLKFFKHILKQKSLATHYRYAYLLQI